MREYPGIGLNDAPDYPSWLEERRYPEVDEDRAYEERRDRELFGDD